MLTIAVEIAYIGNGVSATRKKRIAWMGSHEWIHDILADLCDYCSQNGLTLTHSQIEKAQRALQMDVFRLGDSSDEEYPSANSSYAPLRRIECERQPNKPLS